MEFTGEAGIPQDEDEVALSRLGYTLIFVGILALVTAGCMLYRS